MSLAPAARARARHLAAAKRSLKLLREAAAEHHVALEDGVIPESSFLVSAVKYDQALACLNLLDSLSEPAGTGPDTAAGPEDGMAEVSRQDLAALVLFAHGFVTEAGRLPGSPIARLTEAAFPDGIPVPGQAAAE